MSAPRPLAVSVAGRGVAGLDWGGGGEHPVLLHPNGFCAGHSDPLARRLTAEFRALGVDPAGHGRNSRLAGPDLTFRQLAADVVAALDGLGVESARAVGQSLGGGVAMPVDQARPGLLRRLVLCEGVAFPAPHGDGPNPTSERARARRAVWADRDALVRTVGRTPPLSEMAPGALGAYARWGLRDRPDGTVGPACAPETKAAIFGLSATAQGAPAARAHLPSTHAPAVLAASDRSFPPLVLFEQQGAQAGCPLHVVGGGRFWLQEGAGRAAKLVRALLGGE